MTTSNRSGCSVPFASINRPWQPGVIREHQPADKLREHLHLLDLAEGSVAAAISRSFGINLDNFRIQTDSELAAAFGARAFAYGDQIHFAPGEFDSWTAEGWRVIGHELAHAVQQRLGRVPQTAGIVDDPELEREAHAAGDLAATVFATGRVPATPFYRGPIPAKAHRCAVQCLMSLTDFNAASSASGPRNKVKAIDRELEAFHTLDKAPARDYGALLKKLRSLHAACKTYLRENPKSDRKAGIDKLEREIALEEVVLAPLADYGAEGDLVKAWEHLEQAQENVLVVQTRPEFTRRQCAYEIQGLIEQLEVKSRATRDDAKMISRDIDLLRKLADRESMPPILKLIILEATNAANTRQLDLKNWAPGSAYNTTNGGTGLKYTLKHRLGHSLGRKLRMGSVLHELTHISIAETFDNTLLMFAIRKNADDNEIINLAQMRRSRIFELQRKIAADNDLDPTLRSEMRSQSEYPVGGKLGRYLTDFKSRLGDADYQRFVKLIPHGLDCELIEYDTVINQMALWCALSNIDETNAVYAQLLTLAREAYVYRASARRPGPRNLARSNSVSSMQPQLVGVGKRRGSF